MDVIVSVPHTGTRFLKERLNVRRSIHTWEPWHKLIRECDRARKIYVPLRHPQSVMNTWAKNDRIHGTFGHWDWCTSWYQLHALSLIYDLDIICVDKCEDPRIRDWKRVGHFPGVPKPHNKALWARLFNHIPLVAKHYSPNHPPRLPPEQK